MMVVSTWELRKAQSALEKLLANDRAGEASPPLDTAARREAWSALEAVDRALAKMEGRL